MANLFWKQKRDKTLNLVSSPFSSEEEFERTIFQTKEILEDIFLIKRQVRGGKKSGIPDIIGINKDGNVCIIEMKNVIVDSSVIPQVLTYAFWAQKNPDSIKNLWLETHEQPEDIEVNWDNYEVRIIIIAPSIEPSTLELVDTINYPVDLIEIQRWVIGSNQFLLVNKLEPTQSKKVKPVRGLEVYDRKFYESHFNKDSVDSLLSFSNETKKLVKSKKWPLELKFNKYYCGFKYGFFNAFGIKWIGTKSFVFFFKLPKAVAEKTACKRMKMDKYDDQWEEAIYNIDPLKTKVKFFLPLFQKSLYYLMGKED